MSSVTNKAEMSPAPFRVLRKPADSEVDDHSWHASRTTRGSSEQVFVIHECPCVFSPPWERWQASLGASGWEMACCRYQLIHCVPVAAVSPLPDPCGTVVRTMLSTLKRDI